MQTYIALAIASMIIGLICSIIRLIWLMKVRAHITARQERLRGLQVPYVIHRMAIDQTIAANSDQAVRRREQDALPKYEDIVPSSQVNPSYIEDPPPSYYSYNSQNQTHGYTDQTNHHNPSYNGQIIHARPPPATGQHQADTIRQPSGDQIGVLDQSWFAAGSNNPIQAQSAQENHANFVNQPMIAPVNAFPQAGLDTHTTLSRY